MNNDKFTQLAQGCIAEAHGNAESKNHSNFEVVHVLDSLIETEGPVRSLLQKIGKYKDLRTVVSRRLKEVPTFSGGSPGQLQIGADLNRLLSLAQNQANSWGDTYITVEHLCLAMFDISSWGPEFQKLGLSKSHLEGEFKKMRGSQKADDTNAEQKYEALEKYSKDLTELARSGKLDPVIGRDDEIRRVIQVLSRRTKNNPVLIGEPGVGKTALAEGLAQRIVSGDVPESLKGKQLRSLDLGAMVAGAKFRGEFEERLKAFLKEVQSQNGEIILFIDELHTLVGAGKSDGAMDAGNLLKPMLARGELRCVGATTLDEYRKYIEKDPALERRFQQVLVDEPTVEETISILRGLKEKYEVHHGVHIQDQAIVSAAMLSHRYITDRFLPDKAIDLIDEASAKLRIEIDSMPTEIDEKVRALMQKEIEREALKKEKDPASQARLKDIEVQIEKEKSEVAVLKKHWESEKKEIAGLRGLKEEAEKLNLELEQAHRAGNLARAAEIKYGLLPANEKAQKDAQSGMVKNNDKGRMLKEEVSSEDIASIVAKWTGIPVDRLLKGENEKLLNLENLLRTRVRGQDEALASLADAVRMARSGLKDPNKPIGSFLFLGTTGVGKTETAKALAEAMFDDEQNMVRIDMSEYMEKHSVARLIGAPPGYVGFDEGGQLTEMVRRRPYCVILFDEIEKAHPDVLNVLLQVLDDGRLTDGQGRNVDFKNVVLIMTSNLGSQIIQENAGMSREKLQKQMIEVLKGHMRPEFINRIDDIIIFKPLELGLIREIVDIQIQSLNKVLKDRKINLVVSDKAKDYLAEIGNDPVFGARPLKRTIYKMVQVPLSRKLLQGDFMDEDEIQVDLGDKTAAERALVFRAKAKA